MTTAVKLGYRTDNPWRWVELPKSAATIDDALFLSRDESRFCAEVGRGGQIRHNALWETNWVTAIDKAQDPKPQRELPIPTLRD
jgi:hypothetical protein